MVRPARKMAVSTRTPGLRVSSSQSFSWPVASCASSGTGAGQRGRSGPPLEVASCLVTGRDIGDGLSSSSSNGLYTIRLEVL